MQNLTSHVMSYTASEYDRYTASEMHSFVHNTVLPNLKRSGLNITSCDLVSQSVYYDILSKTGKSSAAIGGGEYFWLTDHDDSTTNFYYVDYDGSIKYYDSSSNFGVRPLITVVKS
jgi:hypothetical protein